MAIAVIVFVIVPANLVEPPRSGASAPIPKDFAFRQFAISTDVQLTAWENKPARKPEAVIFILHGISDSKASQKGTLRWLAEQDVLAVAIDLRAHGQSSGLASYGFHEKEDLSDLAREQAIGRATPLFAWAAPCALQRAGALANFEPDKISPAHANRTASLPMLHFHGTADELIPFEHGQEISKQTTRTNSRFVPIENGGHYNLQEVAPELYLEEVEQFLRQVIP